MQILFHKKNPTEASITIKIEAADYQSHVAKSTKAYSKKASIKGFRPGSVPVSLIRQMYGRSILIDEVQKLLNEALVQYLKEKELRILGEPMPMIDKIEALDWEHQQDFEFEYTIGMAGEFTCHLAKQLKVTGYKITSVAPKTVNDLVEQLRKTHGTIEEVAESTVHDVVHGALHYPAQAFKVQTKIVVEEVAPKAQALFLALSPEDKITFDVKHLLKEDTKLPGVTSKMHETMLRLGGQAEFTVEKIDRLTPAALAPAFFDKVLDQEGIASSEQDFRAKLQAKLIQSKQQEADYRLDKAIQTTLLQEAAIALPDNLLKRWLQKSNHTASKEPIDTYYQRYAQELQWTLLIEKLSQEHNLQVTHEEVVAAVEQRFQAILSHNKEVPQLSAPDIAQLAQIFLKEKNRHNYRQMYNELQVNKVLNLVKDQITITTQEVSVEQFDKLEWA